MDEKFLYRVWHPAHGYAEVVASDRYWALVSAAKEWGIPWRTVAQECVITDLGKYQAARKPYGTGKG